MNPSILIYPALALALAISLTGCKLDGEIVKEGETEATIKLPDDAPIGPASSDPAICDPFGGGGSIGREHGLKANLHFLDDSQPRYQNVADYLTHGHKVDISLYFNQVNVPTRWFNQGFATTTGTVLQTPSGDTLYEWFALKFDTVVRLSSSDQPGRKQFALLADDGAMLYMKQGEQWSPLVSNDGQHGTRFKVAREPVNMDGQTALTFQLHYFQGPRYNIAAILMWRDWPEDHGVWLDPMDGRTGNELFFDYTKQPSEPQQAYKDLLARGWKPVAPANFFLPDQTPANPCPPAPEQPETPSDPEDPIEEEVQEPLPSELSIKSFDGTTTQTSASIIWQTPGHSTTGTVFWGTSPDTLNQQAHSATPATTHVITINGLQPATQYYFKVLANGQGGATVASGVLQKATK